MKNRKKCGKLKMILIAVLFMSGILLPYRYAENVLREKVSDNDTVYRFYQEPGDSIDVLFVGSSHAYRGVSPLELWEESGITSYVLATPSQTFACSYYLIKEGIRTQHPKVVALELYGSAYKADYNGISRLHQAIDCIPFNTVKMELFRELLPRTLSFHERLEFYFPIIRYHSRWDQLTKTDFVMAESSKKGYEIDCRITPEEKSEPEAGTKKISGRALEYLDKIIALCKEEQVELVLWQAPMAASDQYQNVMKKMNWVMEYAKPQGALIADLERHTEAIGLDYAVDFRDAEHLNAYGVTKITRYLSSFLQNQFSLEDHRGDPAYAAWDAEFSRYHEEIEEAKSLASGI